MNEGTRSVDSKKPQFIGQAGRGNQEEFGLLSLEYDENFCMGGPGVIMSRETLSRVAPHIKYCLKNLYTTHEDVELGRCVQKFAGIPCTWSYESHPRSCHMACCLDMTAINRSDTGRVSRQFLLADCRGGVAEGKWKSDKMYPHFHGGRVGDYLGAKTLITFGWDSNLNLRIAIKTRIVHVPGREGAKPPEDGNPIYPSPPTTFEKSTGAPLCDSETSPFHMVRVFARPGISPDSQHSDDVFTR
uniref:Hexosyltransferase n=1 Tax=Timema genevievae TaxID=629358 RepID=A0A7R9K0I0_TIMGE|nr:unnamed protein product [Timema genevievae]